MLVLKHSSPPVSPRWPTATPVTTRPSSSASLAGGRAVGRSVFMERAGSGDTKKASPMGRLSGAERGGSGDDRAGRGRRRAQAAGVDIVGGQTERPARGSARLRSPRKVRRPRGPDKPVEPGGSVGARASASFHSGTWPILSPRPPSFLLRAFSAPIPHRAPRAHLPPAHPRRDGREPRARDRGVLALAAREDAARAGLRRRAAGALHGRVRRAHAAVVPRRPAPAADAAAHRGPGRRAAAGGGPRLRG